MHVCRNAVRLAQDEVRHQHFTRQEQARSRHGRGYRADVLEHGPVPSPSAHLIAPKDDPALPHPLIGVFDLGVFNADKAEAVGEVPVELLRSGFVFPHDIVEVPGTPGLQVAQFLFEGPLRSPAVKTWIFTRYVFSDSELLLRR